MFNLHRALPLKVITHNIYEIGSVANVLFLAGDESFAHKYLSFFIHGLSWNFEQKTSLLRERMAEISGRFDQDHSRYLAILRETTVFGVRELVGLIRDHRIISPAEARKTKLIDSIGRPRVPDRVDVVCVGVVWQ